MANVMIVDRQPEFIKVLETELAPDGHQLAVAGSVAECLDKCRLSPIDLVILEDSFASEVHHSVASFKRLASSPEVVVVTDKGDPLLGELALLEGALNYMEKHSAPRAIRTLLGRMGYVREASGAGRAAPYRFGIVGNSSKILSCFNLIMRSRASDVSVLLEGETGTGKELFAKAIHKLSPRVDGQLVTVDCASLPETLVESLLFGYSRGAFTGADGNRVGLVKHADGGTLFLDEVGELPLSVQKKFLRVLQERRFRPVGGGKEISSDFRLVAATNRNLQQMVEQGLFRSDLLYRLRTLKITLPPLRDRGEDVLHIAKHVVKEQCRKSGLPDKRLSTEFLDKLKAYDWPGNVRELVNMVESAFAMSSEEEVIYTEHLPPQLHARLVRSYYSNNDRPHCPASSHGAIPVMRENTVFASRQQLVVSVAEANEPFSEGEVAASVAAHCSECFAADDEKGMAHLRSLGSFREAKREVTDSFEKDYLIVLRKVTGQDVKTACRVSNLSRARLYELYRKHNILD
ncbi:sigma 54-interacting transcriptional regulator [Oleidesulfovibrio sp.]|uniref:sigma 54-interacting transcriptional regulator n=1 Tax=Oleidesulfovibrio sp. TaxID=2909707 RepID=UPI003A887670